MSDYDDYDDYEYYEYERPVGFLLGLGIFLFPVIFAWFTLRRGHTTKARVISFVWLFIIVLPVVLSNNNDKVSHSSTPEPKTAIQTNDKQAINSAVKDSKPKKTIDIADGAFTVYTKESFPKLYAKYGEAGLKAITQHDASAAFMVAELPECDRVEYVGYSEERTLYPSHLATFVDCANNNRFYVENMQITANKKINLY